MRIALAQLNPTVGDVAGNLALLETTLVKLEPEQPDLVVFPELFLTGYPPLDLLECGWFIDQAESALGRVLELSRRRPETGILVGTVVRTGQDKGKGLFNAAVLCADGRELMRQPKSLLPTCDGFNELRYFEPAHQARKARFKDEVIGVSICEDAWNGPEAEEPRLYDSDPVAELARAGVTVMVNVAASPFSIGREALRYRLLRGHAERYKLPFVFVNQVGGNDELVFDGRSMALDSEGRPLCVLASFTEDVKVVDIAASAAAGAYEPEEEIATVHAALVLGLRDYACRCGFRQAVVGLSGGIDSAVTCAIAVAALGPENVLGVTMPSRVSSRGSVRDSRKLAANLGIECDRIPIARIYGSYLTTLKAQLAGREPGVTEENIQARVRGNLLMALSNESGRLVLATGNKSELAVGYCTLYGDMSGGLALLADVPKTMVYGLARHINRERELVPQATIDKPPSAELRPGQKDEDTLPSYDVLDAILHRYVEERRSIDAIVADGYERDVVEWVARAVDRSEHKRRQAAPGIRVTSKAFGMGRRMPIAAWYRASAADPTD